MSYVKEALVGDERVIYKGDVSIWSLMPLIVLGFLLIGIGGIGVIFWIIALIRYATTELAVTNKRIIAKTGFIMRRTIEMRIDKTESVQVDQSILGRLFDYGSLIISGAGNPITKIPGISDPMRFRRNLLSEIETGAKQQENTPMLADSR